MDPYCPLQEYILPPLSPSLPPDCCCHGDDAWCSCSWGCENCKNRILQLTQALQLETTTSTDSSDEQSDLPPSSMMATQLVNCVRQIEQQKLLHEPPPFISSSSSSSSTETGHQVMMDMCGQIKCPKFDCSVDSAWESSDFDSSSSMATKRMAPTVVAAAVAAAVSNYEEDYYDEDDHFMTKTVPMTLENRRRRDNLHWVNECLAANFTNVAQLGTGAAYCQLIEALFPDTIPMQRVKWSPRFVYEMRQNFEILQIAFDQLGLEKEIPVEKLMKGRYDENMKFLEWFRKFWAINYDPDDPPGDPLAARGYISLGNDGRKWEDLSTDIYDDDYSQCGWATTDEGDQW